MSSISDKYVESTPSLQDSFGDAHVITSGPTDAQDWHDECNRHFGYDRPDDPTPEEEEAHYASYIATLMEGMAGDELVEVAQGENEEGIRKAAVYELGRRLRDLLASSEERAA
jgi:hypothetical protein